jgi:hypothetical protein
MPVMKHAILYSLFIAQIILSEDHAIMALQYDEQIPVIYDCDVQEIYPIDDLDTIFLIPENLEFDFDELTENINNQDDDAKMITIENINGAITHHCGLDIACDQQSDESMTFDEDDDIVPVPHELINAVKKANKKKKKLEKKERKSFLKKSKFKKNEQK